MRTTIRTIAAMSAAILALVSCSKENLIGNGKKNNDGVRVISLSFAQSTKTVLGESGITPKFVTGDVIKLSDGSKTEECTVEENGGVATITTTLSGTLKAIYPASAANTQCDGIVNPLNQDGTFKNANICMATIAAGAEKAVFHNKTAILRFYVDNSIGVKSITVKQAPTAGTDSITITVTPNGKDSFDETVTDGPDKRLCYVSVAGNPAPKSLRFISETTTQGTVSRKPTSESTLADGGMYNAFIPYYIAVDLGEKGVQKWGYCNVGAFLPEEAGLYFMWGETVGQKPSGNAFTFPAAKYYSADNATWNSSKGFGWENCPYTNGVYNSSTKKNVFTKYTGSKNNYAKSGTADGKTVLDLCDDAANANWGGSWRMPTKEEFVAFVVDKTYTSGDFTHKGVTFPAAGYGYGTVLYSVGDFGSYWTSSLHTDGPYYAYRLDFSDDGVYTSSDNRREGNSVRALSD